jgi:hypothetical protein
MQNIKAALARQPLFMVGIGGRLSYMGQEISRNTQIAW